MTRFPFPLKAVFQVVDVPVTKEGGVRISPEPVLKIPVGDQPKETADHKNPNSRGFYDPAEDQRDCGSKHIRMSSKDTQSLAVDLPKV